MKMKSEDHMERKIKIIPVKITQNIPNKNDMQKVKANPQLLIRDTPTVSQVLVAASIPFAFWQKDGKPQPCKCQ